ncbi:MAG TPA: DUF4157 domain-containing protein, partial [Trinickia sp.]|nr:DUF4157 domain-containing protein [Trinickia sp.]
MPTIKRAAPRRAHADATQAAPAAASKATAPSTADAAGLVAMGDYHYAGSVVQRRPANAANRTGLPDELKASLEALAGVSLEHVKVHYRSPKPAQLRAHAYAQGSEIHLAPGQERHLPHEAWHVVQQAQGRVRATARLAGQDVNHDPLLEREADRMGARAQAGGGCAANHPPPSTPSHTAVGGDVHAPVQAVYIIRNGVLAWEDDPYVLQPGESYPPSFELRPSVLVDEGKQEIRYDEKGAQTKRKRQTPVPTHAELQKELEKQGKQLRKRLKEDASSISRQKKQLSDLADRLEKHAGSSVPKDHKKKIKTLHSKGTTTGASFRAVIKAQDEFTQSQASSARLRGFRSRGGDTPLRERVELEEYAEQLLRVLSSLRAPTESIVAPVEDSGTVKGQQHPTSKSQPKLPDGSSGHSYADRARVESQVLTHREAIKTDAPANAVVLASILSAVISTLSGLSAPTSASNLPSFNPSRQEVQWEERERIKDQTNELATELGLPVSTDLQDFDAPWAAHKTPASPKRQRKNAPKLSPKTTPPPVASPSSTVDPTTASPSAPIESVVQLARAVRYSVEQLQAVIPPEPATFDELPFREFLAQLAQAMGDVDLADPQNEAMLGALLASLNVVFHFFQARGQIR